MKGYHLILANGNRYQGAGRALPKVGVIIAGFVVRRVIGADVYLDMPKSKQEWRDYEDWERNRITRTPTIKKKGPRGSVRSP
ncbi:MAG TPA: hypothetical protein VF753_09845 [Terriglobales bacterium]